MFKNYVACIILLCVCNALYCMNDGKLEQCAFSAFVKSGCENPKRISQLAQECFQKRPNMTSQQFINCFRPIDPNHARAAVFPLEFIDKIWEEYSLLCGSASMALLRSKYSPYRQGRLYGCSSGGFIINHENVGCCSIMEISATNGIFDHLCKSFTNIFGTNHKLLDRIYSLHCDFDQASVPAAELINGLAQAAEEQYNQGYDVLIWVVYHQVLNIILADHNNSVFLLVGITFDRSNDYCEISHNIDDAISTGRIKRFNSLAAAINAL